MGYNAQKKRYFPIEEMESKIKVLFEETPQVSVQRYSELTAHFAQKNRAQFLLRGLRNTTDFEYENPIAQANRHVLPDLETVFLITSPEYAYISSSIIRELHRYGENVSRFVPFAL